MDQKKKNWWDTSLLIRRILLILTDIILINVSIWFALYVRFDFHISEISDTYILGAEKIMLPFTVLALVCFLIFKLYNSLWKFASITEFVNIIFASFASVVGFYILNRCMGTGMPQSLMILIFLILITGLVASRFSYRIVRLIRHRLYVPRKKRPRVMIIGAGMAGDMLLKEIQTSAYLDYEVVCMLDDDKNKQERLLRGVKIVGGTADIVRSAEKYRIDVIMIAIPTMDKKKKKEVIELCQQTNCELKTLPGLYQLVNGEVTVSQLRNVEIEDLLGREPIRIDLGSIMGYIHDQVVMVTGGGGSIGSELCRQIAEYEPKKLIILDIYENNAYNIEQELRRNKPNLDLVAVIASVRDIKRLDSIFKQYRPQIVFHAAAHKHVPLMETSPNEAIKNNVFGTLNTARMADRYEVSRFVLISTDKAVNPTNVMGATKRMCEMIVQMMNRRSQTEFVAVRFGNVLGSNGSVIPLFKQQIAAGGPVTVTHPDIIRFFMTIPEAVSLVLQAGANAKGGEIFILDMGEPVRIADLAKNLIRLSGLKLGQDIEIQYTGLRPGEKLYEEVLMDEEGLETTENQLIHIGQPIRMDDNRFMEQLQELQEAAQSETEQIRDYIEKIVPTYHRVPQE